VQDRDIVAMED